QPAAEKVRALRQGVHRPLRQQHRQPAHIPANFRQSGGHALQPSAERAAPPGDPLSRAICSLIKNKSASYESSSRFWNCFRGWEKTGQPLFFVLYSCQPKQKRADYEENFLEV